MRFAYKIASFCLLFTLAWPSHAQNTPEALSVWVNEAIIATYTFNDQNFIARQQSIATYFTSTAWIAYSKALQDAKLPATVEKNHYTVSAVAMLPPTIKEIRKDTWQADMPVLVLYKNPSYQQKQTLNITLTFGLAPLGQGVRGLSILSLQEHVIEPPCPCAANVSQNAFA